MNQRNQETFAEIAIETNTTLSRRTLAGSFGLALAALMAGPALSQGKKRASASQKPPTTVSQDMQRLMSASPEEHMQIMRGIKEKVQGQELERYQKRLGISEEEWPLIRPRIEAVFNMVRNRRGSEEEEESTKADVEQKTRDLRELLRNRDEEASKAQIKAALTALRAAREKNRQKLARAQSALRELMTLRQEALLVLEKLLP